MSDEAQDALELSSIEAEVQAGTEGAEDAMQNEGDEGQGAGALLKTFGSIDVSNLQENTVQVLSGLDPETRAAVEQVLAYEAKGLRSMSHAKAREAAEAKKQAEAVIGRAQYADAIDQLMKNGAMNAPQAEAKSGTTPLTEIDYDAPDYEDQFAARMIEKMGIQKMMQELRDQVSQSVNQNPHIKRQTLVETVRGYWSSLETQGTALSDEQRQIVAKIWDKNHPDPLAVNPSDLPGQLQPIVDAVLLASRGLSNQTEGRRASVANPLPTSGTSAATTRKTPVWEREKRKPTPSEVLRDSSDGISLEQLEKALAAQMGK